MSTLVKRTVSRAIYQPMPTKAQRPGQSDESSEFTLQQQRNLYEFMRRLLVKRFESSFGAFSKVSATLFVSIPLFWSSLRKQASISWIGTIEKIWEEDEETIEEALAQFAKRFAESEHLSRAMNGSMRLRSLMSGAVSQRYSS